MTPVFSIIVPTYNRADLILKTIDSILKQTFSDFEIIVVDDGGTDETESVLESINDTRLNYFKIKNGERGAARNFGILQSKGQYITFIDSDDLLYPNAFENAIDNLRQLAFPECFAQAYELREALSGKLLQAPASFVEKTVNKYILKGNFLACIGVFVRCDVLNSVRFEEDRMFAGTEDWLLWLQLSARFPFYFSNKVCACMIEHENRSVLGFSEEKLLYRTQHLRDVLQADPVFFKIYGVDVVNSIYAHMLSYTSLHLAISDKKIKALNYLLKAAGVNLAELFSRRTLGIIKTILLR